MIVKSNLQLEKHLAKLRLDREDGYVCVNYPAEYYKAVELNQSLKRLPPTMSGTVKSIAPDINQLNIKNTDKELDFEQEISGVFGRLNGYPLFDNHLTQSYKIDDDPFISCIIVLTANDLFVANHLIPSIIQSTTDHRHEIIIVYNGLNCDLTLFENYNLLTSEFGCVAKAYNLGASTAKGELLALFHDDCILGDPCWVKKSVSLLAKDSIIAVTPQTNQQDLFLKTSKCVPLVIYQEDFFKMGGFDENIYIGYEDLEFSYAICENGFDIAQLPITFWHFEGMSTILMMYRDKNFLKYLFSYHFIPKKKIKQLADYALACYINNHIFGLSLLYTIKYIVKKHKDYIDGTCNTNIVYQCDYIKNMSIFKKIEEKLLMEHPELKCMGEDTVNDRVVQLYKNLMPLTANYRLL